MGYRPDTHLLLIRVRVLALRLSSHGHQLELLPAGACRLRHCHRAEDRLSLVRAAAGRREDRPVLCIHVDGHRSLAHGHGHLLRTRVRALRDGGRVALVRHLRPTVVLDLYLSFVRAGTHTMRILPAFPHHS